MGLRFGYQGVCPMILNPSRPSVAFNGKTHSNIPVESTEVLSVRKSSTLVYPTRQTRESIFFDGPNVEWAYINGERDLELDGLLTGGLVLPPNPPPPAPHIPIGDNI